MTKFFYATTEEPPHDGLAFIRAKPNEGVCQLKRLFACKKQLHNFDASNPLSALKVEVSSNRIAMVAFWSERKDDVIDLDYAHGYFVGEFYNRLLPSGGSSGPHLVLADGRALRVSKDGLERMNFYQPKDLGLGNFRGCPKFLCDVYV